MGFALGERLAEQTSEGLWKDSLWIRVVKTRSVIYHIVMIDIS